jgi:hypothetical protein
MEHNACGCEQEAASVPGGRQRRGQAIAAASLLVASTLLFASSSGTDAGASRHGADVLLQGGRQQS